MKISTSILNANFMNLEQEIKSVTSSDYLHIDVMDGNFVPKISFGSDIAKQVIEHTTNHLDVHLMTNNTLKQLELFYFDKKYYSVIDYITVHYESNIKNINEVLDYAKSHFQKVGISIKPNTDVKEITNLLSKVDLVLIMTVEPGEGGQKAIFEMQNKINYLASLRETSKYNYVIEIDGGINSETISKFKNVDIAVVGSAIFNQDISKRNKYILNLKKNI